MITSIHGKLLESTPLSAIIEAGGLGYEVNIPITTAEKLPIAGKEVKLHTLAVYREDSHSLYGFYTRDERDFFRLLVEKVSGIGPRTALSILSKLSVDSLKNAIAAGDVALLSKCPGIGKKTAERLIIELQDKIFSGGVTKISSSEVALSVSAISSPETDAIAALVALGYRLPEADKSVRNAAVALGKAATTEALIRAALGN